MKEVILAIEKPFASIDAMPARKREMRESE